MQNTFVETLVGALVLAVAAGFVWFAADMVELSSPGGYEVTAKFSRVDGISTGADVRMSGVKVGAVRSVELDPQTFYAKVTLSIEPTVQLPEDSSVKVTTAGLLGASYLSIEPGASPELLAAGGEIANTQGAVDFVSLISRAVFGAGGGQGGASGGEGGSAAPEGGVNEPQR